jgi:rubrerythrin
MPGLSENRRYPRTACIAHKALRQAPAFRHAPGVGKNPVELDRQFDETVAESTGKFAVAQGPLNHRCKSRCYSVLCLSAQAAEIPQKTIDNLNAAYRSESNPNHRYTLFAQKADAEGYPQVAKHFRAAEGIP